MGKGGFVGEPGLGDVLPPKKEGDKNGNATTLVGYTQEELPNILHVPPLTESDLNTLEARTKAFIPSYHDVYGILIMDGSYAVVSSSQGTDIFGADKKSILSEKGDINGCLLSQIPENEIHALGSMNFNRDELIKKCEDLAKRNKGQFTL